MKGTCLFLISILSSCGITPKSDLQDEKKLKPATAACQGDYNPISLFVPGRLPIDPDSLPLGTYEDKGLEIYANDDRGTEGNQQAHFQEIFFGESPVLRPVCHTTIDSVGSAQYLFPTLSLLTVRADGTKIRRDATYQILNSRGKYSTGVVVDSVDSPQGISALMAKFTVAQLYQTGAYNYELHGEIRRNFPAGTLSQWVLQRILLTPP